MDTGALYELMPSPTRPEARARAKVAPRTGARPHVCFVAPTTWPVLARYRAIEVVGGAEVQQSMIARALACGGYRVSMICHDYGQPDGIEVDGITIHNMHKPDGGIPVVRFFHPRFTSLWSALARADADVYYQRSAAVWTGFVAAFCRRHGRASIYAGACDVDFVPYAEVERYFNGARVFLNTSDYEGFPNTFLQSWSRGVPTVAFFDTGSRRAGEPPYDLVGDVGQAARAIDRLMRDDVHWHQASQRSAAHFRESHSMDAVIAMYEREIAALAGSA